MFCRWVSFRGSIFRFRSMLVFQGVEVQYYQHFLNVSKCDDPPRDCRMPVTWTSRDSWPKETLCYCFTWGGHLIQVGTFSMSRARIFSISHFNQHVATLLSARTKSWTTTGNILNQDVHNLYFTTGCSMFAHGSTSKIWHQQSSGHPTPRPPDPTHPSLFRFRTRLRSQHRKPQLCRGMDLRCYGKIPEKGC